MPAVDPPTVRLLTDADLPAYKALRDEGLRTEPTAFTSDYASASRLPASTYAQRLGQPPDNGFILGAWDAQDALIGAWDAQDALIGAVVCVRAERQKERHLADLVGMIVAPAARGHGVGSALLQAFDAHVRELPGVEQILLSVTASNTAAVRLYAGAGFQRYGLLPRAVCVDGVYHDKALMCKTL